MERKRRRRWKKKPLLKLNGDDVRAWKHTPSGRIGISFPTRQHLSEIAQTNNILLSAEHARRIAYDIVELLSEPPGAARRQPDDPKCDECGVPRSCHQGLPHGFVAEDTSYRLGDHCPRCDSYAPHLHPAVQFEGKCMCVRIRSTAS